MFRTNSDYQKKLLKRWAPILEKGAAIDTVEKKLALAQCLENTRKEFTKKGLFTEAAPTAVGNTIDMRTPPAYNQPLAGNGVLTANDYILPNVVMPMLRRIFPTLMAHELVGVQAMTGPTGLVMALRAVGANAERVGLPKNYEFGYGERGRMNQSRFTGDYAKPVIEGSDESALQNKLFSNDPKLDNDIGAFLNGQYGSYSGRGVPTGAGEGYATGGGYAQGWADQGYAGGKPGPYEGAAQTPHHYGDEPDPTFGHWRNNTYPQATLLYRAHSCNLSELH